MVELKCFHGTSKAEAQAIVAEQRFIHSIGDSRRLGEGAYFFNQMGSSADYPIMCSRELCRYKFKHKQGSCKYAVLFCVVQCDESQFFDLSDPNAMEAFHQMRYIMHERNLRLDSHFKYKNASVADTQVIEELKKTRPIAVIRAPQFFGMFEREQRMAFSDKHVSQNPRTYVPNVVNLCVNTNLATIRDITIVEEGEFDAGHEDFIV